MHTHTLKESTYIKLDGSALAGAKDEQKILLGHAGHKVPLEQALKLGLVDAEGAGDDAKKAILAKHGKPAATKEAKPGATK